MKGFSLWIVAAALSLMLLPDLSDAGCRRGRRGGGSQSAGGCSSCGQSGSGSCGAGACASCGQGACDTCTPSPATGYQWVDVPGVACQKALILNGKQIGCFDADCNCYAEYKGNDQWGPRGVKCPVDPPVPPKKMPPGPKTSRANCPEGCDCGCAQTGVCSCGSVARR